MYRQKTIKNRLMLNEVSLMSFFRPSETDGFGILSNKITPKFHRPLRQRSLTLPEDHSPYLAVLRTEGKCRVTFHYQHRLPKHQP